MNRTDRHHDMIAALNRADGQARIHASVMQHDAIVATLADRLTGLPRLRWSRPSGHGAAGVRGRADDGDLKQRIAAVATYASTSGGDHFIDVLVGLGEATAQTSVVLAGVPVTVETVIWTRRPGRRRLRQADAEDIVISALADAKQPVRVRRWDGTRFRVA